jgi:hypothetical protein
MVKSVIITVLCLSAAAQTPKQTLDPRSYEQIKKTMEGRAPATVESGARNAAAIRKTVRDAASKAAADQAEATAAALKASIAAETAARIASDVKMSAETAASQATAAAASVKAQNSALLIVQSFALLTFLCLLGERLWYRFQDVSKEKRDHQWQVDSERRAEELAASVKQVHSLVNSNYTAALENELDARKSNLILLKANMILVQSGGGNRETTNSISAAVASTSIKITELTKTLAERVQQTEEAAKQLKVDLGKIQ